MQRRIGIAQALINDPDLLILDEPTTGLDPIGTRQVKDLILELGRRGKTVILSSHLLSDVEDVVDRMAILYGGKMRGEGTCEELLASTERTLIETDELDEATIAELDEVIRRRTGGEKSIRGVSAPRQRLEELFLGIVERAQSERATTSGAMQGGSTAAFLRGQDQPRSEGEQLIESLMQSEPLVPEPAGQAPSDETAPETIDSKEDEAVIDSLMHGRQDPSAPSAASDQAPPGEHDQAADVDLGVIGSLLENDEDSDEDNKESGR